jgi:hypothetical protein
MLDKLKEFFSATVRFPGAGFYAGCGRYTGFMPSCGRYGLIINLGWFWIMFITYDFVASSRDVMNEVMEKRRDIQKLQLMYSGRTTARRGARHG